MLNPSEEVLQSETGERKIEIPKAFIEQFAKLIIQDTINIVEGYCETSPEIYGLPLEILEHFDMELDEDA